MILPLVGRCIPRMSLKSVVFPPPFYATNPMRLLGLLITRFTSFSACAVISFLQPLFFVKCIVTLSMRSSMCFPGSISRVKKLLRVGCVSHDPVASIYSARNVSIQKMKILSSIITQSARLLSSLKVNSSQKVNSPKIACYYEAAPSTYNASVMSVPGKKMLRMAMTIRISVA